METFWPEKAYVIKQIFQDTYLHNVHDHPVDDLCLAISLWVEGRGLSELSI